MFTVTQSVDKPDQELSQSVGGDVHAGIQEGVEVPQAGCLELVSFTKSLTGCLDSKGQYDLQCLTGNLETVLGFNLKIGGTP